MREEAIRTIYEYNYFELTLINYINNHRPDFRMQTLDIKIANKYIDMLVFLIISSKEERITYLSHITNILIDLLNIYFYAKQSLFANSA